MDFPLPPEACLDGHWRPLKLEKPAQRGWDVYALQTGLLGLGLKLPVFGADGRFGGETAKAVGEYQSERKLLLDHIAGGDTQREIGKQYARRITRSYGLPSGLAYGQIEKESSFLPGNYSALRADGHRDCGIVERNDSFIPQVEGFDTPVSVEAYGDHTQTYFNRYRSWGVGIQRAWELAAGAWNAHAWTDKLARGEALTSSQLEHITAYISAVTSYVRWA